MYPAPRAISSWSLVKTSIIYSGIVRARRATIMDTLKEKRRAMPWTTSMALKSFLPKYWAQSMVAPVPRP